MTDETSITVQRSIDVAPAQVFDLLTNPDRHAEFDGSGFLRSADHPQRISAVGDTFRMNMAGDHMGGDYQTDNVVTGYDENHLLAWQTAPAGVEPPGWEWVWQLDAEGADSTRVTLVYDWSNVTDPDLLKQISFPLVSQQQLEDSLDNLGQAVTGS